MAEEDALGLLDDLTLPLLDDLVIKLDLPVYKKGPKHVNTAIAVHLKNVRQRKRGTGDRDVLDWILGSSTWEKQPPLRGTCSLTPQAPKLQLILTYC